MASNNAVLVNLPADDDVEKRIKALESEATRYRYSPVFQETVALLRKTHKPHPPEKHVSLTMPLDQAEKLYGLLGQVTRHSGLDPIFQSLEGATFVLKRQRPKLHFVRDNVLHADF
jgi:hypothetical protein